MSNFATVKKLLTEKNTVYKRSEHDRGQAGPLGWVCLADGRSRADLAVRNGSSCRSYTSLDCLTRPSTSVETGQPVPASGRT